MNTTLIIILIVAAFIAGSGIAIGLFFLIQGKKAKGIIETANIEAEAIKKANRRLKPAELTAKLQDFITDYRTRKARVDVDYYQKLTNEAKKDYEAIREKYVNSADANTDVILESVRAKVEDMENEMQLKYDAYTTLDKQLQAAKAKVQERTPAFTMIKGSSVPIKPAGPKRMIFVAGMIFLSFICTAFYLVRKELFGL